MVKVKTLVFFLSKRVEKKPNSIGFKNPALLSLKLETWNTNITASFPRVGRGIKGASQLKISNFGELPTTPLL